MGILPLRTPPKRSRLRIRPIAKRGKIIQKWVLMPMCVITLYGVIIKIAFSVGKMLGEYLSKTTDYDAIIIGAGWAGLKAAQTLLDDGFSSILILEANDYIGGRAKSINTKGPINSPDLVGNSDNLPTEMGCEWLYLDYGLMEWSLKFMGIIQSTSARDSKEKESIDFYEAAYYSQTVNADGIVETNLVKAMTATRLRTVVWDDFRTKQRNVTNVNESYADAVERYKVENNLTAIKGHYLDLMNSIIEVEYAGDNADMSSVQSVALTSDTHYTSIPGQGFGNIAGKYAEPFKSKIKLNANVIEVNYSDERKNIITYVEDGANKTVTTDAVLVTVALGVLKAKTINFIPTLPKRKQEVIDNMGFGLLNKCIMQWSNSSDVVWPRDKFWLELIASDEASADKWTSFFNPTSFKNVPVLVGFIAGQAAIDAENQTDDNILEDVMKNLKAMYPTIRKPDNIIITRWGKETTARGSYAFKKINRNWQGDRENLQKGIKRLWFAGEATFSTPGTTIAAWETGAKAARSMASVLIN